MLPFQSLLDRQIDHVLKGEVVAGFYRASVNLHRTDENTPFSKRRGRAAGSATVLVTLELARQRP